eukprot:SAG31_NODE_1159_length_9603_cov_8.927715_6_plen_78_part_00
MASMEQVNLYRFVSHLNVCRLYHLLVVIIFGAMAGRGQLDDPAFAAWLDMVYEGSKDIAGKKVSHAYTPICKSLIDS